MKIKQEICQVFPFTKEFSKLLINRKTFNSESNRKHCRGCIRKKDIKWCAPIDFKFIAT